MCLSRNAVMVLAVAHTSAPAKSLSVSRNALSAPISRHLTRACLACGGPMVYTMTSSPSHLIDRTLDRAYSSYGLRIEGTPALTREPFSSTDISIVSGTCLTATANLIAAPPLCFRGRVCSLDPVWS